MARFIRRNQYDFEDGSCEEQNPKSILHKLADDAVVKADTISKTRRNGSYFGGDPSNMYHEVRRFLLQKGIDTRVFTFGSIPLPASFQNAPVIAENIGTIDNSFFFEFRKVIQTDEIVNEKEFGKVNTLVLLARVFFETSQNNQKFHVQLVLNHFGDSILELNDIYDDIIFSLKSDSTWTEPSANFQSGRIPFFEKTYTDDKSFKTFMTSFLVRLRQHKIFGNNLFPTEAAA
jgi:hypothetical protein